MEMQIVSLLLLQTLYDMVNQHQLNFSTILNFKGYKENSEGTYVTHANKSLFTHCPHGHLICETQEVWKLEINLLQLFKNMFTSPCSYLKSDY